VLTLKSKHHYQPLKAFFHNNKTKICSKTSKTFQLSSL